jgi:phosphoribosylpyrophosphate synthetase
MEILTSVIVDYDYPVINNRSVLKENSLSILRIVNQRFSGTNVRFVGMGTSGAMILTSIATINQRHRDGYSLIKKPNEQSHRGIIETDHESLSFETGMPVIVVDDRIASGQTMINIALRLKEYDIRMFERVQVVSASGIYNERTQAILVQHFPNLKLIITN